MFCVLVLDASNKEYYCNSLDKWTHKNKGGPTKKEKMEEFL